MVFSTILDGLSLAKGALELGMGVYALSQNEITIKELWNDLTLDTADVNNNIKAVQSGIETILENQASLMALFKGGHSDICDRLDSLENKVSKGFATVIQTIDNDKAEGIAREFKTNLELVNIKYNELVDDIIDAAEEESSALQSSALARDSVKRNAQEADAHADKLYAWAKGFLPSFGDHARKQAPLSRQQKVGMMPYIVAMAYAVRVQVDARMVESHSMPDKIDRKRYLKRSRRKLEDFVKLLRAAVLATVRDTSLLEMALDYHFLVATYMLLIASMQASVQVMFEPKKCQGKRVRAWDDGLSRIRSLIRRGPDGATTIDLDTVQRGAWWLSFINYPRHGSKSNTVREHVPVYDLVQILGAAQHDDDHATCDNTTFHLVPEYRHLLFDLPPAASMRTALLINLASALGTAPRTLGSTGRIRNAHEISTPFESRAEQPALPRLEPRLVRTLTGHSHYVNCVAVSSDGLHIVSASSDVTAKVWCTAKGNKLRSFKKHSDVVACVALFSDSKRTVSGAFDGSVRIWSLKSGRQLLKFAGHSHAVYDLAVSPDDCTVASASEDKTIKLWNARSGLCEATLTDHCSDVWCVAFSADGQTLASGGRDRRINLWNVHTGSLLRTITGHTRDVSGVAFADDLLVSCSADRTIKVWKWKSGELHSTLTGNTDWVSCIAVFPDKERVVSGSDDSTVKIWNLRSGVCEHTLGGHVNDVKSVAVSHDGRTLLSASGDKSVKVWAME